MLNWPQFPVCLPDYSKLFPTTQLRIVCRTKAAFIRSSIPIADRKFTWRIYFEGISKGNWSVVTYLIVVTSAHALNNY